jgi:hypothetical protein
VEAAAAAAGAKELLTKYLISTNNKNPSENKLA